MNSKLLIAALVLMIALVEGAAVVHSGARLSSDSETYSKWADLLIANHFNVPAFLRAQHFVIPPVFYSLWIATVAVAKLVAGPNWARVIAAANWATAVAVSYGLLATVRRLTDSRLALGITAFLFLAAGDVMIFVPFALSDILFLGLSTMFMLCVLRIATGEAGRAHNVLATFSLIAAMLFRPTAAPLIALLIFTLLIRSAAPSLRRVLWVLLAAGACAAILLHAAVMQETSRWPFVTLAGWMTWLSREYHQGIVVFGRPATFARPPVVFGDFVLLTVRKWLAYFHVISADFSLRHRILNSVFFIPAYLLAAAAFVPLFARALGERARRARIPLILTILFFSIFHAVQQIDFDDRYRLPVLPPLMLLAALGASAMDSTWRQHQT